MDKSEKTIQEQLNMLEEHVRRLESANVRLRRELAAVRQQLRMAEKKANVDELTKCFRLGPFTERLQEDLLRPDALPQHVTGKGGVLLFLDIIDFKAANERFGHAQANNVLRHIVQILFDRGTIRIYDTACIDKVSSGKHEVGRFGGDEFLIYCGEVTEDEARKIALRVKRKCESEPITVIDNSTGTVHRVVYSPRLHVAGVWWPRDATTWTADDIIRVGGEVINEAKKGRHDPEHISWRALATP